MAGLDSGRLAGLRRAASAATPGPWAFPHQKDPYGCYLLPLSENNASYIAAFGPEVALELLDRIEELEDVLRKLYEEAVITQARYCGECGLEPGMHDKGCMMAEVERVLGLEGGSPNA